MFEGFYKETTDFMWQLRFNNNKPWFEAHKEEYQQYLLAPMKALSQDVFAQVVALYGDRGFRCKVSRIYKDARRVRGGDPYRDHLWFSIERPSEEWTSTPVFWFELSPDSWSYGLGYYQAKAETMAKFRARLCNHTQAFEKLIAPLENQTEFILDGTEYVRKKTPPTEKTAPWFNKKSFSLVHAQNSGEEIFSEMLSDRIAKGYQFLMPMYDYLITLDGDPTPKEAEKGK